MKIKFFSLFTSCISLYPTDDLSTLLGRLEDPALTLQSRIILDDCTRYVRRLSTLINLQATALEKLAQEGMKVVDTPAEADIVDEFDMKLAQINNLKYLQEQALARFKKFRDRIQSAAAIRDTILSRLACTPLGMLRDVMLMERIIGKFLPTDEALLRTTVPLLLQNATPMICENVDHDTDDTIGHSALIALDIALTKRGWPLTNIRKLDTIPVKSTQSLQQEMADLIARHSLAPESTLAQSIFGKY